MEPKEAFTLLEVLVAMLVLSIGILGLSHLQSKSARYNYIARQISQSVNAGKSNIESILQLGYHNIHDLDGDGCNGLSNMQNFDNDNGTQADADYYKLKNSTQINYHIYWNCCDNNATNNTKKVRLFVVKGNNIHPSLTFNYILSEIN